MYYNRAGQPIGLMEWAKLSEAGNKVKQDRVSGWLVSTVWLGLDHRFGAGPPLIFETMIFPPDEGESPGWWEEHTERYTTEDGAVAGHDRALAWLRDKLAG